MVAVTSWATPEIDARIVALKQIGFSHTRIAVVIVAEFRVFVNKNMVLRRSRTILGIDRGEKAANARLERKRKAERAAMAPKEPAPRPVNVPAPAVTLPRLASVIATQRPPEPRPEPRVWVVDDGSWPTGPARRPCQFVTQPGSVTETWIMCGLPVARGAWCRSHLETVYHRVGRAA